MVFYEVDSPDKEYKAVIFERSCGATTNTSFQISILKKEVELTDDDKGNLLIAEIGSPIPLGPIAMDWTADSVHIHLNSVEEIFLQKDSLLNLPIHYTYGIGY